MLWEARFYGESQAMIGRGGSIFAARCVVSKQKNEGEGKTAVRSRIITYKSLGD